MTFKIALNFDNKTHKEVFYNVEIPQDKIEEIVKNHFLHLPSYHARVKALEKFDKSEVPR